MANATDEILEYLRDPRNWEKAGGGALRPTPSPPDEIDQILEWMKDPEHWVDVGELPAEPKVAVPAQPSPPPIPQVPSAGEIMATPPGRPVTGPLQPAAPKPASIIPTSPVLAAGAALGGEVGRILGIRRPEVPSAAPPSEPQSEFQPPPGAPGLSGALLRAEEAAGRAVAPHGGLTIYGAPTLPEGAPAAPVAPAPPPVPGEEPGAAERYYKDFLAGLWSLPEGLLRSAPMLEAFFGVKVPGADFLEKGADIYATAIEQARSRDPDFLSKFSNGLGSMVAFIVANYATRGALLKLKAPAWIARTLGLSVPVVLESLAEASSTFSDLLRQGVNRQTAATQAGKAFAANVVLVSVTNRAGIFSEGGTLASRAGKSFLMEGPFQESPQSVIQDVLTGRPINWWNAFEAGVIGGVLGGGAVVVTGGAEVAMRGIEERRAQSEAEAEAARAESEGAAAVAGAEAGALREELERGAVPAEPARPPVPLTPEAPTAAQPRPAAAAAVAPPVAVPPRPAPAEARRPAPLERPRPLTFQEFAAAQGRPGINAAEPGFIELRRAYDNLQATTFAVKPRARMGAGGLDVTGYQVIRIEDGSPVGVPYLSGAAAQLRANRLNAEAADERIRAIREPIPTIRLERRPEPEVAAPPAAAPPTPPIPAQPPPAPAPVAPIEPVAAAAPLVPSRPAVEPQPTRPEETRINVPEAEDFLSRMRVEGPGGEIRAGAAFDPRIVKVLGNTLYSGDLGQITVKEMIQNAVDSIRWVPGGAGRVSVNVDSASRTFRVDDTGTGMTLAVATKEFLDPGASLKPPEASGGLGIAKVAILGNADRIGLVTTALDPDRGGLVTTRLTGSGTDWLAQNLRVESGPAEEGAKTGTSLEIQLGAEARFTPHQARSWLEKFLELQRLPGQKFDFTYDGAPVATTLYTAPQMASVPIPGGTMTIYQGGQVGLRSFVEAEVLNRGLPQFSKTIYLPREVQVPWRILVDISATGSPEQGDYPFRPDREGLRDNARRALDDWVRANLFETGAERERETYRTMWENAPRIPGTPDRVVDTANKIPPELVAEIATKPYLKAISRALRNAANQVQALLVLRDAKYAHGDYGAIGLGGDYLGVNVPGKFLGLAPPARVILVNPYRVAQEVRQAVDSGVVQPALAQDELAEQLAATLLHELTHNIHPGHESEFAGTLTRNIGRAAIQHRMAVNRLRRALKGDAYANILADLDRISGYWGGEDLFGKIAGGDAEVGERPGGERPARLGPEGGARPGEAVPVGLPRAPEGVGAAPALGERPGAPGEPGAPGVRGPVAAAPERGGEPGAAAARGALAAPIEVGRAGLRSLAERRSAIEAHARRYAEDRGIPYYEYDLETIRQLRGRWGLPNNLGPPEMGAVITGAGASLFVDDDADGAPRAVVGPPPLGAARGQIQPRAEEPLAEEPSAEQAPGIRPPSEVGIPRRRGAGVRLVGLGISPEARGARADFVEYRGQRVWNARDVARLLQPTRDPRWETFRIVYVDDAGNVLAVEAVSSRHVRTTIPFLDTRGWNVEAIGRALDADDVRAVPPPVWKMRQRMRRLGATGYWLSHNHPTGKPQPSRSDESLSETFSAIVPGFRGHVVIDSGSYGVVEIGATGPVSEVRPLPTDDRILEPSIPHPVLGRLILNPADLALAIPDIVRPEGYLSMLYLGSDGRVRAIEEIPVNLFLAPRSGRDWPMADYIRGAKRDYGADQVIAYAGGATRDIVMEAGDRLVDSNLLTAFQHPGRFGIEGPTARVRETEPSPAFRVQEPEGGEFRAAPGAEVPPPGPPRPPVPPAPGWEEGEGALRDLDLMQREPTAVGLVARLRAGKERFIETQVNKFHPVAQLTEALQELQRHRLARAPAPGEAPIERMELAKNKTMGRSQVFSSDLAAVIKDSADVGLDADLNRYLTLKNFERTIAILAARPEGGVTSEGRTAEGGFVNPRQFDLAKTRAALSALADRLGPERQAATDALARRVWALNRTLLDEARDVGLVGQEAYDVLVGRGDDYVPRQVLDYLEEAGTAPVTRPYSVRYQDVLKRLEGTERDIRNVLASTMERGIRVIGTIERNRAARAVTDLAPILPGLVDEIPGDQFRVPGDREVVSSFVDGRRKNFSVSADIARAMTFLDAEQIGLVGRVLSVAKAPLQAGATGANVAFAIPNVIRDIKRAAIFSRYGVSTPADVITFASDWFRGMASVYNQDAMYERALRSGALFSTIQKVLTPETFLQAATGRPTLNERINVFRAALRATQRFNSMLEESTKLQGFIRGIEMGRPESEVAYEVANFHGSPNFGRSGSMARHINLLWMFYNARLQGTAANIRRIRAAPGTAGTAALARIGLYVVAPTLALWAYNQQWDDDHGMEEISDTDKQRYHVILLPGTYVAGDGTTKRRFVKIVKEETEQIVGAFVTGIMERWKGTHPDSAATIAADVIGNLSPVTFTVRGEPTGRGIVTGAFSGILSSANPLLRLPAEIGFNYHAYQQRPLVPRALAERVLPEEQVRPSTSPTVIRLAQLLSLLPLAEPVGLTSPIKLQHAITSSTGGVGQSILDGADALVAMGLAAAPRGGALARPGRLRELLTGYEKAGRAPVLSRFIGTSGGQQERDAEDRFYEAMDRARRVRGSARRLGRAGAGEEEEAVLADPANEPYLANALALERMGRLLSRIYAEQVAEIYYSDAPLEERRAALRELAEARRDVLANFRLLEEETARFTRPAVPEPEPEPELEPAGAR